MLVKVPSLNMNWLLEKVACTCCTPAIAATWGRWGHQRQKLDYKHCHCLFTLLQSENVIQMYELRPLPPPERREASSLSLRQSFIHPTPSWLLSWVLMLWNGTKTCIQLCVIVVKCETINLEFVDDIRTITGIKPTPKKAEAYGSQWLNIMFFMAFENPLTSTRKAAVFMRDATEAHIWQSSAGKWREPERWQIDLFRMV